MCSNKVVHKLFLGHTFFCLKNNKYYRKLSIYIYIYQKTTRNRFSRPKNLYSSARANTGSTKGDNLFDNTMGSFDGAKICELIGLFLLHKLNKNGVKDVGLYRDDGAGALKLTPRQMEQTKKTICRLFAEHGLKITIEANKKTIDFIDVTFDLTLGTYKPYSKPNTKHLYVHTKSNPPPGILKKNLPKGINTRLSNMSCSPRIPGSSQGEWT